MKGLTIKERIIVFIIIILGLVLLINTTGNQNQKIENTLSIDQSVIKVDVKNKIDTWLIQYIMKDEKTGDISYEEFLYKSKGLPFNNDKEGREVEIKTHYASYVGSLEGKILISNKIEKLEDFNDSEGISKSYYDNLKKILDLKYNKNKLCFLDSNGDIFKDKDIEQCNPLEEGSIPGFFSSNKMFCYVPVNCDLQK